MPVESMTREERRAWLAATAPRHDLMQVIRSHIFRSSRPWPDGTAPTAPNWNPGCSCGEGMYFSQWDGHLADVLLAAGYAKAHGEPVADGGQS